MKAVVCDEPFSLKVVSRPAPMLRPGEALVRIRRVGLCGTDYHIYGGRHPFLSYPRVMGHELSGQIDRVGEGSSFSAGQIVAINPYLACGTCLACRRDKPNACAHISVLGVHTDGGMCEVLAVPERALIDVGDLTLDEAVLLEFLAIGAHAAARATLTAGDRVLVVGAGPIGIATSLFARLNGAHVTLVDRRATRLAYARESLDFQDAFEAGDELNKELSDKTHGEFFDAVFDATGSIPAMNEALGYVGHGGKLVFVGVSPGVITIDDPELHKREVTLLSSRNALHSDFARVIAAIQCGKIRACDLLTHHVTSEELPKRLPELIAEADHVLKAVVSF